MKLLVSKIRESEPAGVLLVEQVLHFVAAKPIVIQPSEIMKVQTNSVIRIVGDGVLNIVTADRLAASAGELFPGVISLDNTCGELILELAVRNSGRNQINILIGDTIAKGYFIPTQPPEIEEFSVKFPEMERPKTRPQKKNEGVKFEVK